MTVTALRSRPGIAKSFGRKAGALQRDRRSVCDAHPEPRTMAGLLVATDGLMG